MTYQPPLTLTPTMLGLIAKIQQLLGRLEGLGSSVPRPELRRGNRAMAIHSSCAIEGNSLSLDQVQTILAGKKVLAPAQDIREIANANRAYDLALEWSPHRIQDFCQAHGVMMDGLIPEAGHFRQGNVGIIKGRKVTHIAPKPRVVPQLMSQLFGYVRASRTIPKAIVASVCHYEIEFIHPFTDGNGRMGRLWQHVILVNENPLFGLVPFESIIQRRQKEYYSTLRQSDLAGESTVFVEFSLDALYLALEKVWHSYKPTVETPIQRLIGSQDHFGSQWFSRKEYLAVHKTLSTATASRDLAMGVSQEILMIEGSKATARYRFKA